MARTAWQRRTVSAAVALAVLATVSTSALVTESSPLGPAPAVAATTEREPDPRVVVGEDPAEPRRVGGGTGQDVASNIAPADAEVVGPKKVARTLWWSWRAPSTGSVRFSTVGSEVDTALVVRDGSSTGPVLASETDAGDLTTAEAVVDVVEGRTYTVEVSAEEEEPQPGLVVLAWQPLAAEAPAVPDVTPTYTAAEIPIAGTTGEKPQSKLWQAHGTWWAVAASTTTTPAGTWVWRRDGQLWSAVQRISDRTDVRADVLPVAGDVVHVLLHGPVTTLVSLAHAPGNTYVPWSSRPEPTV